MDSSSERLSDQIKTHHQEIDTHDAHIKALHTEIHKHEAQIKAVHAQIRVHEVQSASHRAQALQLAVEQCQVIAQQQKAYLQGAQVSYSAADDNVATAIENQRKFAAAQLPPKIPAEVLSPLKSLQGRMGRASEGGPLPLLGSSGNSMNHLQSPSSTIRVSFGGASDIPTPDVSSSVTALNSSSGFRVPRMSSSSPGLNNNSNLPILPPVCDNNGHKHVASCNSLMDLGLYTPSPPDKERVNRDSNPLRRSNPNNPASKLADLPATHYPSSVPPPLLDIGSSKAAVVASPSSSQEVKKPKVLIIPEQERSPSPSPLSKVANIDPVTPSTGERTLTRCISYKMALSSETAPAITHLPHVDPMKYNSSSSSSSSPVVQAAVRTSNKPAFGRTPSGHSAVGMSYEPPSLKSMVNTSPLTTMKGSSNPVDRVKGTK